MLSDNNALLAMESATALLTQDEEGFIHKTSLLFTMANLDERQERAKALYKSITTFNDMCQKVIDSGGVKKNDK